MRKIFAGAASLFASFVLYASETSVSDAELVAKGWLRDNASAFGSMGTFESVLQEKNAAGETLWFMVILEKGSVIVSPDTEIEPIIAVLPRCKSSLPGNHPMRALLERDLSGRLAAVKEQQASATPARGRLLMAAPASGPSEKWSRLKRNASTSRQLMAAHTVEKPATIVSWLDGWNEADDSITCWTQEEPFDAYTPMSPLGSPLQIHSVVGCVATAGSSVLHYLKVPSGKSRVVRTCSVDGVSTNLYTIGGTYDWSLFDGGDEEQLDELKARVSYDVGVASKMGYSAKESGAYTFDLASGLVNVFGLTSARYVNAGGAGSGNGSPISYQYYPKLIYNQIRAGMPVVLGISSTTAVSAGHEVVACGYGIDAEEQSEYTYIFCGWAGQGDAWYNLPYVDTKATAGGASAAYDVIGDMITLVSKDEETVPVVGRVVDKEGVGVADVTVTLGDGKTTTTDASGYWGFRVNPNLSNKVVYDPIGEPKAFVIGSDAHVPTTLLGQGTSDATSAAVLSAALPEAIEMVVDRDALGGYVQIVTDYNVALKQALAEGKLIHVIAGYGEAEKDAYKAELRKNSVTDASTVAGLVFWQPVLTDANGSAKYPRMMADALMTETVDPRLFDPKAPWGTGAWTEGVAAWQAEDRTPKTVEIEGDTVIDTTMSGAHPYVLAVTYSDGVEATAPVTLAAWTMTPLAETAKASFLENACLIPNRHASGKLSLEANLTLFGVECSATLPEILLVDGGVKVTMPTQDNPCVTGDEEVGGRAVYIAMHALVNPAYGTKSEIAYGEDFVFESRATLKDTKRGYRCAGLRIYADGELAEEVDSSSFETNAAGNVTYAFTAACMEMRCEWIWTVDSCSVVFKTGNNDNLNFTCDAESGFYPVGSSVAAKVTPGESVGTNKDWTVIWQGCDVAEIQGTGAKVEVTADAPRTIQPVAAVNISNESETNLVTVATTNSLVVLSGYEVVVEEVLESEYGESPRYRVKVVSATKPEPEPGPGPGPDPEPVPCVPFAFTAIGEQADGSWSVTINPAVKYCKYTLQTSDDLVTWVPVGETVEATADGDLTFTGSGADAKRFWKVVGEDGEVPQD